MKTHYQQIVEFYTSIESNKELGKEKMIEMIEDCFNQKNETYLDRL